MVVSGMNKPDHRPIAAFRRRHKEALEGLFNQVVMLCEQAGLVQLQHVAIDGTKLKANASRAKNMSYQAIKDTEHDLVARWFAEAEATDAREDKEYGDRRGDEFPKAAEALDRIRKARKELEERDKRERTERKKAEKEGKKPESKTKSRTAPPDDKQYNFTDPDSGLMRSRQGFIQGYISQIAVGRSQRRTSSMPPIWDLVWLKIPEDKAHDCARDTPAHQPKMDPWTGRQKLQTQDSPKRGWDRLCLNRRRGGYYQTS